MTPEPPTTYREAYMDPRRTQLVRALLDHAFENGVMLINTGSGALSTAMTEREIDLLTDVLLVGFRKLKEIK
jgi:glutamate-1-semialdehyde 2,1-aminomutase